MSKAAKGDEMPATPDPRSSTASGKGKAADENASASSPSKKKSVKNNEEENDGDAEVGASCLYTSLATLGAVVICVVVFFITFAIDKAAGEPSGIETPPSGEGVGQGGTGGGQGEGGAGGGSQGGVGGGGSDEGRGPSTFQSVATEVETLFETSSLVLEDENSPQHKATAWLAEVDRTFAFPLQQNEDDHARFRQRYAMAVVYYALGGDDWFDQCNFLSLYHECSWSCYVQESTGGGGSFSPVLVQQGISCDNNSNTVTGLRMVSNNLIGVLPTELGAMSNLESLDLRQGQLDGSIPSEIYNLSRLSTVWMQGLGLSGTLSSAIGDGPISLSLRSLDVSDNEMTGTIPEELCLAERLVSLYLSNNLFSGNFPECQQSFELVDVEIQANQFTGDVSFLCDSAPRHSEDIPSVKADCFKDVDCDCCAGCY